MTGQTFVRYVATELATDIVVNVGDVKFYLHKVWTRINLSSLKGYSALISMGDINDYICNSHIFLRSNEPIYSHINKKKLNRLSASKILFDRWTSYLGLFFIPVPTGAWIIFVCLIIIMVSVNCPNLLTRQISVVLKGLVQFCLYCNSFSSLYFFGC